MDKKFRIQRAKQLRKESTPAEDLLWQALRRKQMAGVKWRRQHVITPFILDFYCPKAQLAVELDGGIHESQKEYDRERDDFLNQLGIQVLRFPNSRVATDLDGLLAEIALLVQERMK